MQTQLVHEHLLCLFVFQRYGVILEQFFTDQQIVIRSPLLPDARTLADALFL
jgi:hypothetical protein